MNSDSFYPDWFSHPGKTILDMLRDQELSVQKFSCEFDCSIDYMSSLLQGNEEIDIHSAKKLESILGGTVDFWLERESQYRRSKERIYQERKDWINQFPISDMLKNGWINKTKSLEEKYNQCLSYFGVQSINHWHEEYSDMMFTTSFRTSSSFDSSPESVITWLRQGEIKCENINCKPWNTVELLNSIPSIRALSRTKKPQIFIPILKNILAKSGVALAIVRTPRKCHASGATYFLTKDKAILLLSFRYLSDDHFWFSLFHEIGHLLLHGDKKIFLEGLDDQIDDEERKMENEANIFSEEVLIPKEYKKEFMSLNSNNWKEIVKFAKKIGISHGIVVGQLQHNGIIRPDYLNKLKTKYKWVS